MIRCMCCIYWNWESSVPMSNYRRVVQGTPGDAASLGPWSPRERRSAWHQRRATKAHVHCDGTGLGPWNPWNPWKLRNPMGNHPWMFHCNGLSRNFHVGEPWMTTRKWGLRNQGPGHHWVGCLRAIFLLETWKYLEIMVGCFSFWKTSCN